MTSDLLMTTLMRGCGRRWRGACRSFGTLGGTPSLDSAPVPSFAASFAPSFLGIGGGSGNFNIAVIKCAHPLARTSVLQVDAIQDELITRSTYSDIWRRGTNNLFPNCESTATCLRFSAISSPEQHLPFQQLQRNRTHQKALFVPFIPFHLPKNARDGLKAHPFTRIQQKLIQNGSEVRL